MEWPLFTLKDPEYINTPDLQLARCQSGRKANVDRIRLVDLHKPSERVAEIKVDSFFTRLTIYAKISTNVGARWLRILLLKYDKKTLRSLGITQSPEITLETFVCPDFKQTADVMDRATTILLHSFFRSIERSTLRVFSVPTPPRDIIEGIFLRSLPPVWTDITDTNGRLAVSLKASPLGPKIPSDCWFFEASYLRSVSSLFMDRAEETETWSLNVAITIMQKTIARLPPPGLSPIPQSTHSIITGDLFPNLSTLFTYVMSLGNPFSKFSLLIKYQ